jgi:hypothetical protein
MFSPGGYNRGLHGRPQARTLTAAIVQRLVDECPMSAMESALGRCRLNVRITPGSGRRADIGGRQRSARSGREQMQQSMGAWTPELLDQLVREDEQPRRYFNPERLGSSEIDHQLELGGLLNR